MINVKVTCNGTCRHCVLLDVMMHDNTSAATLWKALLLYYYKCITSILSRENIINSLFFSIPTISILMRKHKANKRPEQYSSKVSTLWKTRKEWGIVTDWRRQHINVRWNFELDLGGGKKNSKKLMKFESGL